MRETRESVSADATIRTPNATMRLVAIALSLLMGLLPLAATSQPVAWADGIFASGSGTSADPYVIDTAAQLQAFRDAVNGGTSYDGEFIQLGADLSIAGSAWTPIGTGTRTGSTTGAGTTPFKGVFDGGGHTITGLTITTTTGPSAALGLFGVLDGGVVKNLNLADVNVTAATSELAGGAVGLAVNGATISGVSVSGTVSGTEGIGGVVGRMIQEGTITDCTNSATVSCSAGNAGGIVGAAYYTLPSDQMLIDKCQNTGNISGAEAVGGIVGLSAAFVTNSTNEGAITVSNYSAGGIVGEQRNYGSIVGCTNTGDVTNTSTSGYGNGGIVGWVRYDGASTAYSASSPVPVANNTNTATVKGGNDAGGIVGTMYSAGTVTGNTNQAPALSATTFAGGIVGNLQDGDSGKLPATVAEGITVENNVSTTPETSITAADKDLYAYDNSPSVFTVADNSTAWVAEANTQKFATVGRAVSEADGSTVKLIADAPDVGTITEASGRTTTLDLNGHSIDFDAVPALKATSGTLVVMGTGTVYSDGTDISDLVKLDPASGDTANLVLEGGAYQQDVVPYVGKGYAELVLHDSASDTPYLVLPAQQAYDAAAAYVTADGHVTYYENLDDAKAAAEATPGAVLTELTADADGNMPPVLDSTGATVTADAPATEAPTTQTGVSSAPVTQTGDGLAAVAGGMVVAALIATTGLLALAVARRRTSRTR